MNCLRLCCLILLGILAGAHSVCAEIVVDDLTEAQSLAGEWEFRPGDDLRWADPGTSGDGEWIATQVPGADPAGRVGFPGMGWYRLTIQLATDKQAVRDQLGALGLTLGNVMSAYELYVNGQHIGRVGGLPPEALAVYDHRKTFSIPPSLITDDGRLMLALRVWRDPDAGEEWQSGPNYGEFLLGNIGDLRTRSLLDALLPNIVLAALYLVLGLYHLLIARRNPSLREFFWFGLFCVVLAIYTVETSQSKYFFDLPYWLHKKLEFAALYSSPILLAATLFAVTRTRSPLLFRGFSLVFGVFTALILFIPGLKIHYATLTLFQNLSVVWALSLMVMMLVLSWQGNREARLVVVMLLLLVAAIVNDILLTNPIIGAGNVLYIVFALILLGMAILMAERYTQTLKQLEFSVEQRTAELVESNRELANAVEAKTQFLATMSHEMRTPMNAILGLTHLAQQTELDEQQRDYLVKVDESAAGLRSIIDAIFDFTLLESGEFSCDSIPFSPATLLQNVVGDWRGAASEKDLTFQATLDPSVPDAIAGDGPRLAQLLGILIGNAIKFTDSGTVSLAVESLGSDGSNAELRFTVSDTGIGIGEQTRAHMFESFTQADSTMSRSYGGTGMGLAIAQRLLRAMGGVFSVTSEPAAGSTFSFALTFPVASAHEIPAPEPEPEVSTDEPDLSDIRGAQILLVDDSEINLQVAGELLRQAELYVDTALNGAEAVEKVRGKRYDCVLMDIQMPVMDGYAATETIRSAPEHADLPILALTANALPEDRVRGAEAGMNAFIAKPIEPLLLFGELLRWIPAGERSYVPEQDAAQVATASEPEALPDQAPGLNVAEGLVRVGGNSKLYLTLLGDLCRDYADVPDTLRTLTDTGDSDGARQLAHKLRGIANNLGARDCGAIAERIELAIQAGANLDEDHIRQLHEALAQVIATNDSLRANLQTASEGGALDARALSALVARAQEAVAENNPEALDVVEDVLAGIGEDHEAMAAVTAARDALDLFDFDAAREQLENAAAIIS